MKKTLNDYRKRALKNLTKIRGGQDGPVDRDKVLRKDRKNG